MYINQPEDKVVAGPKMAEYYFNVKEMVVLRWRCTIINLEEMVVCGHMKVEYETKLDEMVVAGPKMAE
jgi:hypothetical protein